MSLDVWLIGPKEMVDCRCDCGHMHLAERDLCHYEANITHNLNRMADRAGIYRHLWRPDEIGIAKACQLIEPLEKAIADMKAHPETFKQDNPENGWGTYEGFVRWCEDYLKACKEFPEATVRTCR